MEFKSSNDPTEQQESSHNDRAVVSAGDNIVRYRRRAGQDLQIEGTETSGEILFINDSTPDPSLPFVAAHVPFHRRRRNDDDVLYIGPD